MTDKMKAALKLASRISRARSLLCYERQHNDVAPKATDLVAIDTDDRFAYSLMIYEDGSFEFRDPADDKEEKEQ